MPGSLHSVAQPVNENSPRRFRDLAALCATIELNGHEAREEQPVREGATRHLWVPPLAKLRWIVAHLGVLSVMAGSFKQLQAAIAAELHALLPPALCNARKRELS